VTSFTVRLKEANVEKSRLFHTLKTCLVKKFLLILQKHRGSNHSCVQPVVRVTSRFNGKDQNFNPRKSKPLSFSIPKLAQVFYC